MEEWNVGDQASQAATRLSSTCYNLTKQYGLYPVDNGKLLEGKHTIQSVFYNDTTISEQSGQKEAEQLLEGYFKRDVPSFNNGSGNNQRKDIYT